MGNQCYVTYAKLGKSDVEMIVNGVAWLRHLAQKCELNVDIFGIFQKLKTQTSR